MAGPVLAGAGAPCSPGEGREVKDPLFWEEVSSFQRLEALGPEWTALWERCPRATPFQSPGWLVPWWRHFGRGELFVMALRQAGLLAGMAPFFLWRDAEGRRHLSLLGAGISDYTDVLLQPGIAFQGSEEIMRHLREIQDRWEVIDLQDLSEGSPLLAASLPEGLHWEILPGESCPVLSLPAAWKDLQTGLSPSLLRSCRRAWRQLHEAGRPALETAGEGNRDELLESLFRLHRARWAGRGRLGMLEEARLQAFHREAAAGLFRQGLLRLYGMRLDGEIISVLYALAGLRSIYAYLGGFDPAWERFSPGMLLIGYALKEAIQERMEEFDFLRGRENYKYHWGARDRWNYRVRIRSGC